MVPASIGPCLTTPFAVSGPCLSRPRAIGISLAMTLGVLAACLGIISWMFRTGYRLSARGAGRGR